MHYQQKHVMPGCARHSDRSYSLQGGPVYPVWEADEQKTLEPIFPRCPDSDNRWSVDHVLLALTERMHPNDWVQELPPYRLKD